jgi:hypothetical protein
MVGVRHPNLRRRGAERHRPGGRCRRVAGVALGQGRQPRRQARHYQRPPVEALIAAGYLNEDEAAGIAKLDVSVRDMSSDALALEIGSLVAELRRRAPDGDKGEDWGEGSAGWVGNTPEFQQHPAMRRHQSF